MVSAFVEGPLNYTFTLGILMHRRIVGLHKMAGKFRRGVSEDDEEDVVGDDVPDGYEVIDVQQVDESSSEDESITLPAAAGSAVQPSSQDDSSSDDTHVSAESNDDDSSHGDEVNQNDDASSESRRGNVEVDDDDKSATTDEELENENDDEDEDEDTSDDDSDNQSQDSEVASLSNDNGLVASKTNMGLQNRVKRFLCKQMLPTMPMCLQSFHSDRLAVGNVHGQVHFYKFDTAVAVKDGNVTSVNADNALSSEDPEVRVGILNSIGMLDLASHLNGRRAGRTSVPASFPNRLPSMNSVRSLCLSFNYNNTVDADRNLANGSTSTKDAAAVPSCHVMLAASKSGHVSWLDLDSERVLRSFDAGAVIEGEILPKNVDDFAISCMLPLSEHAVALSFDSGSVVVVDSRTSGRDNGVLTVECDAKDRMADLLLCGDGHTLLGAGADGCLYSFDTRNRRQMMASERMAELTSLASIAHGQRFVAGALDGRLYIFNKGQYGAPCDIYPGHKAEINSIIKYTPTHEAGNSGGWGDDNTLLTGDSDGYLRLLHLFPHKQVACVGKQDSIEQMSLQRDNSLLFALSEIDEEVTVWDCSALGGSLTAAQLEQAKAAESVDVDDEESSEGSDEDKVDRHKSTPAKPKRDRHHSSEDDDSSDEEEGKGASSSKDANKSRKMPRMNNSRTKNEEFFADMS